MKSKQRLDDLIRRFGINATIGEVAQAVESAGR